MTAKNENKANNKGKNKNFNKSWTLITGASKGLGKEFAFHYAQKKQPLLLVARSQNILEEMAAKIRADYGVEVLTMALDLALAHAPKELFSWATSSNRQVSTVVNNAGVGVNGETLAADFLVHRNIIDLNVMSLTELSYLFAKHMLVHKLPSNILNVASVVAYQPIGEMGVYSASKAFVKSFTHSLAYELKGTNVAVSCLSPGGTATEFMDTAGVKLNSMGMKSLMTAKDVVKIAVNQSQKGRMNVVPGFINKLLVFIPRFLPEGLSMGIFSRSYSLMTHTGAGQK